MAVHTTPVTRTEKYIDESSSAITHRNVREQSRSHSIENRTVADDLTRRVRVLCWVMTHPDTHQTRAKHVKATWGKRCNKLLFMSSVYDRLYGFHSSVSVDNWSSHSCVHVSRVRNTVPLQDKSLPTVKLPVYEGRDYLWAKTKEAFRYVYEQHRRDADWFLKADDDTYVVVENLRYLLINYNSKNSLYFGCRFKPFVKQGYMGGGAGYVLSREALNWFVNKGLPSPDKCSLASFGPEDIEMGTCMERLGVKAMDTRDSAGRGRFFAFTPTSHIFPIKNKDFWYWKYLYYPAREGLDCCSDFAITFHYIGSKQMYLLDYLIYNLRPYGIHYKD